MTAVRGVAVRGVAVAAVSLGCGAESPGSGASWLGREQQAFVNGADDRREYFELESERERAALEQSGVALMTDSAAQAVIDGRIELIPTWRGVNLLCQGEPFAEQPSAAFCSGVLLDYNLVLTSGHCIDVVPLEELRVAFGYYYEVEGELAMVEGDSYAVEQIVAARRDPGVPEDDAERLDYAWLELAEPVRAPRRPAAAYTTGPGVSEGDAVISVGAGGGVPIKWDDGGHVQYLRAEVDDYFIADTDTSQGSSGGAVLAPDLAVVGSLARGAADFSFSSAGCFATNRESDPALALEQFTYVHRAVEGLCSAGSSSVLCDPECEQPCDPGALEPAAAGWRGHPGGDDDGCALAEAPAPRRHAGWLGLALALAVARRRARARQ